MANKILGPNEQEVVNFHERVSNSNCMTTASSHCSATWQIAHQLGGIRDVLENLLNVLRPTVQAESKDGK